MALTAALAAGSAFVVLESESRSGLLALALTAALLPLAWLMARAAWRTFGLRAGALAVGLGVGLLASLATGGLDGTAKRVGAGVARQETSGSTRVELWKGTVATIAASPIVGYGPDGLALAFPRHRPELDAAFDDYDLVAQSSHNWALDTMANLGIPGFAALTAVMVFAAWGSVRTARAGRDTPLWVLIKLVAYRPAQKRNTQTGQPGGRSDPCAKSARRRLRALNCCSISCTNFRPVSIWISRAF